MTRRVAQQISLSLLTFACVVSGFGLSLWLRIPHHQQATLVRLSAPTFSSVPCARSLTNGLALEFRAEWAAPDDLIAVINGLYQRGWRTATNITSSVELLPTQPEVFELWLVQVQVFRGVTLSYTPKRLTRYVESTAVRVCPG